MPNIKCIKCAQYISLGEFDIQYISLGEFDIQYISLGELINIMNTCKVKYSILFFLLLCLQAM